MNTSKTVKMRPRKVGPTPAKTSVDKPGDTSLSTLGKLKKYLLKLFIFQFWAMVFKSLTLFARSRGPDEFWRKRRIFKLSAHFQGRRRNCYSVAVRYVHRALVYATRGRRLKKEDMINLWETRISAACEQLNFSYPLLKEGLSRCNIMLNRKSLADLAIWEPRTFKSLAQVAWSRTSQDGLADVTTLGSPPPGVITRGMLKDNDS